MNKDIIEKAKNMVLLRLDTANEKTEEEVSLVIEEVILNLTGEYIFSIRERIEISRILLNDIKKLDVLQELLEDDSVTEIMVNGYNNIFYEKDGKIKKWDKSISSQIKLCDIVQRIAAMSNKIINESVPIGDTRLNDGSRVNIVMNPIAIEGPVITIRKFYDNPITIDRMIEIGSITKEAADFLQKLVIARYNIFISGGTGSGKTTFLNALSNYIPKEERIITIEDSAELRLLDVANLVRLEARSANVEGKNGVSIRDLIKSSLRMRPDRIIVGEVRGEEAIDMLQAMNTGHDGSLSTGHSNGPEDMMLRLETMVLMSMDMPVSAVRGQIASAIDIVVHLGRLRDKSRRVLSISEVIGFDELGIRLNTLYEFVSEGEEKNGRIKGSLKRTEKTFSKTAKQKAAGFSV